MSRRERIADGLGQIRAFVAESNAIEGIHRAPTQREIDGTVVFLSLPLPSVDAVERLVDLYQPGAILRRKPGLDVRVGSYIAPPGGPEIEERLRHILAYLDETDPWQTHVAYETLHPFTDGNGRSGRALWAWQMVRRMRGLPLGFLHQFYYQTLERSRP